ncbi:lysophospholipid acyltransferase family protein [Shewanella litorisediminis]|uniref:Lysophospholipid acyltransferase family protein n=1 Tax=Shewanella litorisediminis TaxID=1173586 RepID=A0ABX7G3U5_9GAMM|nr:lysophospholipid acyltransferase family protein [Shewanella litorisediminis]MCL2917370.1 lysophospholipid acyltransferase family protein [Shewanella litorisediminis]QRH01838.1 lysophospholipid acyltransferase family protein [Shewanella litorisediminis]
MFNAFCRLLMKLTGWRFEGELPALPSYIMTVAPHTSNWDFIVGVMARGALGERIHFLGKHQLFIPPWGWFFRAIGGSPVDRRKNNNLVDAVSSLFEDDKEFKLALAPEGTRSNVNRWKTGFYHIAVKAQVPIVTVGLDFAQRKVVIAPPRATTGDMQADMNAIIAFYRRIKGRFPKQIPDYVPSEKDQGAK